MAANTVASPANNGDASSPTAPLCASSPVPVVCAPLVLVVFAALLPEPPVVLLLDVAVDEDEVEDVEGATDVGKPTVPGATAPSWSGEFW